MTITCSYEDVCFIKKGLRSLIAQSERSINDHRRNMDKHPDDEEGNTNRDMIVRYRMECIKHAQEIIDNIDHNADWEPVNLHINTTSSLLRRADKNR